ncbi:uncharacterized protein, partial [Triticum aestivum]|uniref:uncharacterized protein n=1 Tax=Triticum aestivum TaxID=4565 RepID=UPI001D025920
KQPSPLRFKVKNRGPPKIEEHHNHRSFSALGALSSSPPVLAPPPAPAPPSAHHARASAAAATCTAIPTLRLPSLVPNLGVGFVVHGEEEGEIQAGRGGGRSSGPGHELISGDPPAPNPRQRSPCQVAVDPTLCCTQGVRGNMMTSGSRSDAFNQSHVSDHERRLNELKYKVREVNLPQMECINVMKQMKTEASNRDKLKHFTMDSRAEEDVDLRSHEGSGEETESEDGEDGSEHGDETESEDEEGESGQEDEHEEEEEVRQEQEKTHG